MVLPEKSRKRFPGGSLCGDCGAQEDPPSNAHGKEIIICSDSEALIRALTCPGTTSKLVKECKQNLNRLGSGLSGCLDTLGLRVTRGLMS